LAATSLLLGGDTFRRYQFILFVGASLGHQFSNQFICVEFSRDGDESVITLSVTFTLQPEFARNPETDEHAQNQIAQ